MKKKRDPQSHLRQYILTGAALGLYFGWFFRPLREPSLWTIVGLALTVTIVMTLLRVRRGEREELLQYAGGTFVRYAVGIAILELRHPVFDWGGRIAVTVMTTACGALFGYWMARKE